MKALILEECLMHWYFRQLICAALFVGLSAAIVPAQAQGYPSKPVRMVVPYPSTSTPSEVADKLSKKIAGIVRTPAIRERLLALGAEPVGNTPAQFERFNRNELSKWDKIVKQSGTKAD
jgi:tripartite-type tricarboxylate transporter receptor subunit TctC